ncbi:unnamed protein product [Cuscuta epithymum]|uniref:Protein MIZU-KUSSEI 1 n=1 Tax=Cuscuta epithymum TaxID=186058 RepID=A0AAV0DCQ6_9ASTE|nr:unnamed protein product [Cuscuta epithymum]
MANNSIQDLSPKKHHWTSKVSNEEEEEDDDLISINHAAAAVIVSTNEEDTHQRKSGRSRKQEARRKLQAVAVSRLKSMLTMLGRNRRNIFFLHHHHHHHQGLGTRLVGTLFGFRSGHVHLALQKDPVSRPVFLVELATPIAGLVREMASGLVRIALECDKEEKTMRGAGAGKPLLEEPVWRTYCNGKKCGFAARRETGEKEWEVLKAVEPISMGAGVLPNNSNSDNKGGEGGGGEIMYMRAKFERVVGSRDSEALYMMNPDSHGAPELSIYLLRI